MVTKRTKQARINNTNGQLHRQLIDAPNVKSMIYTMYGTQKENLQLVDHREVKNDIRLEN